MKKKMTYVAPETEQMDIKIEASIMSTQGGNAPAAMNVTHTSDEWGDWE